jgi:hypothetical protein
VGDVEATVAAVGRELLDGPLDEYVARRKAVARRLRDGGDREAAKAVEGIGKPTVVLFAALRAADDPGAVRAAVDATAEVARVQTGAGDRSALGRASADRRARIDELVATGLAAAGGGGGSGRADEVRAAVDLLTRHDEVLDAWLDGTLRDLPRSDAGFGALGLESVFADVGAGSGASTARPSRSTKGTTARAGRSRGPTHDDTAPAAPTAAQRRAREKAEEAVERAEAALDGATASLAEATEALALAQDAVTDAEAALRAAQRRADDARRAQAEATERRDAAAADLDERRAAFDDLPTNVPGRGTS